MTPPTPSGFWRPSNFYLAQVVHFLVGILILQAAALQQYNLWLVYAIFAAITAIKEFAVDTSSFEGDTYWGSTQDWIFYQLGAVVFGISVVWHFWIAVMFAAAIIGGLFGWDVVEQRREQPYD